MRFSHILGTMVLLAGLCVTASSSQARDTDHYQALKQFSQVLDLIEKNYVQEVNRTDLIHGAIQGMLNSIDPHSTYIDLEKFKMMQEEFQGEFGGIGIQIGVRDKRLMVIAPIEDTPADKAGLKAGDVILKVNGEPVEDSAALLRTIAGMAPGEKATLGIWRQGKEISRKVTLEERGPNIAAMERGQGQGGPQTKEQAAEEIGVSVRPVSPQEARALGMDKPQGLVITGVREGSPAAQSDVRPGDVVLEANQNPVSNVAEFQKIVREDGKKRGVVMLLLKRQGRNIFRTIGLE